MHQRNPAATVSLRDALFLRVAARAAFWKSVPAKARVTFLAGVFCTFSVVGFVTDIFALGANPPWMLAMHVVFSGLVAVAYAVCAFRNVRLLLVAVGFQLLVMLALGHLGAAAHAFVLTDAAALDALRARLAVDGFGCILGMVLGYGCFVVFISTEGQRYLRVHTEMVLARHIHRSLVPEVAARLHGAEVLGHSFPSGEVGGDLVDLLETREGWIALVADVSGHGVQSGVLTAMVKSAARMTLRAAGDVTSLLTDLNETLVPIIERNMFVTCACLQRDSLGHLTFAAAGHPPMLHYRHATGDVIEHNTANLALGIFAGQAYASRSLPAAPGDVLLLLTDGLIEVFDRHDGELGLPAIGRVFGEHATGPLRVIAQAVRDAALAHGPQTDDQTLLVIRVEA